MSHDKLDLSDSAWLVLWLPVYLNALILELGKPLAQFPRNKNDKLKVLASNLSIQKRHKSIQCGRMAIKNISRAKSKIGFMRLFIRVFMLESFRAAVYSTSMHARVVFIRRIRKVRSVRWQLYEQRIEEFYFVCLNLNE